MAKSKLNVTWKKGTQFKCDPTDAYREIMEIRQKHGGDVQPEQVVEKAKPKRNPLHPDFEWDDTTAATEHRLNQARHLLRCLVAVRDETTAARPQRVFEITRTEDPVDSPRKKNVYRTLEDIMADPDSRAELLGRALQDLIRVRNRYRDLQELAVVMRAIDEVLESVK